MANGEVNCILSVCCPEGSDAQRNALATAMARDLGMVEPAEASASKSGETFCQIAATYILAHFDLAEKGTLAPFKASIARLAREPRTPHA